MIGISFFLGERHRNRATGEPHESGIVSTGTARLRFTIHFDLIAMIYVVFNLEAAFIIAWAVAIRDLGWSGYIAMLVFIVTLSVALFYLWRLGVFDQRRKRREDVGRSG